MLPIELILNDGYKEKITVDNFYMFWWRTHSTIIKQWRKKREYRKSNKLANYLKKLLDDQWKYTVKISVTVNKIMHLYYNY